MLPIEQEIAAVETIFRRLTGAEPKRPETPYAPIPPEVNAEGYVRDNLNHLYAVLQMARLPPGAAPAVAPPIGVFESDAEWACVVDLPGVAKENVRVQLTHALEITATRQPPLPAERFRPAYLELPALRFERTVPLPHNLKLETVTSKLEHGTLVVRIAKAVTGGSKQVNVES